jgi:hypothetical protein
MMIRPALAAVIFLAPLAAAAQDEPKAGGAFVKSQSAFPEPPGFLLPAPSRPPAPPGGEALVTGADTPTMPTGAVGQPQGEAFSNKNGRFSLRYPKGWQTVPHPSLAFQARRDLVSPDVIRVRVEKTDAKMTSAAYANRNIKRYGKFWALDESVDFALGAYTARRVTHSQAIDGRLTRAVKIFLAAEGLGYMIDCQSTPGGLALMQPLCEETFKSFMILPKP